MTDTVESDLNAGNVVWSNDLRGLGGEPPMSKEYASSYAGTGWHRKSDGATIIVQTDVAAQTRAGTRSLVAFNVHTRRSFRITPEGLHRKYRPATAVTSVFAETTEKG